jgi:RNA polymerase sigma factor (sigma-70 family)
LNTANPDIVLWEAFRSGDKEAFATIFKEHYDTLYRYGSKFIDNVSVLEDAIQELFIELWQAKSRTPVVSVRAYLLKSLKYKLLKSFRQKGKQVSLTDNPDIAFEWSHEHFLIAQQESAEKKQSVLNALAGLTNRQKEIIYLKFYRNLSYEEVSEIMNINYQVARNLLYQAIKSLKSLLSAAMIFILLHPELHLFPFWHLRL